MSIELSQHLGEKKSILNDIIAIGFDIDDSICRIIIEHRSTIFLAK